MTHGQYQADCKAHGRTDVAANNRAYWRKIKAAIEAGKPILEHVRTEYDSIVELLGTKNQQGGRG